MILKRFNSTATIYVGFAYPLFCFFLRVLFYLLFSSNFSLFTVCHSVSQQEIVSLYQRFCQLDRNAKGFISADEFLSVPEFAMNPLSQVVFQNQLMLIWWGFRN